MGSGLVFMPFVTWINYFFPSLSGYTHIIAPLLMVVLGFFSVATKIMPIPGHVFEVPDLESIDVELKDSSVLVLWSTKLTRVMTIGANWLISTKPYGVMFRVAQRLRVVHRIQTIREGKNKGSKFSKPEKFVPHVEDEDNRGNSND
jgi:hypothetical protein